MCLFNGPQSLNYRDSICALPVSLAACVYCVSAAGAVQQIGPFSVGKIIDSLALGALLLISRQRTPNVFFLSLWNGRKG